MSLDVQADDAEVARSCLGWATNDCGQAIGDRAEARGYVAHCVASIAMHDVLMVWVARIESWKRFVLPVGMLDRNEGGAPLLLMHFSAMLSLFHNGVTTPLQPLGAEVYLSEFRGFQAFRLALSDMVDSVCLYFKMDSAATLSIKVHKKRMSRPFLVS